MKCSLHIDYANQVVAEVEDMPGIYVIKSPQMATVRFFESNDSLTDVEKQESTPCVD